MGKKALLILGPKGCLVRHAEPRKFNSGLILSSMRVELMEVVSDQYHKIPFGMVSSTTPPFGLAFLIAG